MENDFLKFISDVRASVLHGAELSPAYSTSDSELVLSCIPQIAQLVLNEMARVAVDRDLTVEERDVVLDLERILRRLRSEENIRLDALKKFDAMSVGGVAHA
jgi:hypothetical protein